MPYKVFISHSTRDRGLVIALASLFSKLEVEASVAEWYLTPGERLDKKVFAEIDESDYTIVLLTKNGMRSNWVHQEIGYALKSNKPAYSSCRERNQFNGLSIFGGNILNTTLYNPSRR